MGKFAKGSLITAGVLFAVGFILCLISVFFGGKKILTDKEFMNEKFHVLNDALDRVNIDLGNGKFFIGWDDDYSDGLKSDLTINDEVFNDDAQVQIPADEVKNLALSLGAGTFIIEEKDIADGIIDITFRGVGTCDYRVDGDTLHVEGFKNINVNMIHINEADNKITLKLPADIDFDSISTEIGAGIMKVSNVDAKDFDISLGAGEIDLEKMNVNDFSAEIGAGSMDAEEVFVNNATLTVSMGECVFAGNISGNLSAECDMGNMELDLDGKQSDHNYKIECAAGNISMDGFEATAISAEKNIDNGADSTYSITCSMGNIDIEFDD